MPVIAVLRRRSTRIVLSAFLLLVVAGGVWWLFFRRESLLEAAHSALRLVEGGNGRALERYVRPAEAKAADLSADDLQSLVILQLERLTGFRPTGGVQTDWQMWDPYRAVSVYRTYTSPDGRKRVVGLTMAETSDGPKLLSITKDLIFGIVSTYFPPEEQRPALAAGYSAMFAKALTEAMPGLQSTGIAGWAQFDAGRAEYKLVTWDAMLRYYEERAAQESEMTGDLVATEHLNGEIAKAWNAFFPGRFYMVDAKGNVLQASKSPYRLPNHEGCSQ